MADDPPTTSDKAWENRDDKAWRKTGPVRKVVRRGQLALTRDADAPEEDAVYGSDIANRPKSAHLHHSSQDFYWDYVPNPLEMMHQTSDSSQYHTRQLACAGMTSSEYYGVWTMAKAVVEYADQLWEELARTFRLNPGRSHREAFVQKLTETVFREGVRMFIDAPRGTFNGERFQDRRVRYEEGSRNYPRQPRRADVAEARNFNNQYPEPALNDGVSIAITSIPHYLVLWCLTVGVVVGYDVGDARSAACVPVVALRGEAVG